MPTPSGREPTRVIVLLACCQFGDSRGQKQIAGRPRPGLAPGNVSGFGGIAAQLELATGVGSAWNSSDWLTFVGLGKATAVDCRRRIKQSKLPQGFR